MDWNRRLCIIIYSLVLVQCTSTLIITYLKVKKSAVLYALSSTLILSIMWLIFGMFEIQSTNTEELLFAVRFSMLPISLISGTWLIFVLLYSGLMKPNWYWLYAVIMLPLVITYAPMLTRDYFHLSILYKSYEETSITLWGPWQETNYLISYSYMAVSMLTLIIYAIKTYKYNQYRVFLLGIAPLIPVAVAFLGWREMMPEVGFDLTPVTFSVMLTIQSVATFRFSAFDQIRQGAMDVFRNTDEALVILDEQNRIIDYNNAGSREFALLFNGFDTRDIYVYLERLKDQCLDITPINHLIHALKRGDQACKGHIKIMPRDGSDGQNYYDFYMKPIYNNSGLPTARLISLKNRTEESKVLLEVEHQRISREIHDGISNLVNVIGMNLEYIQKGRYTEEELHNCIETAFITNNRMRFEIRRILDELVPLNIEKNGLENALQSLFKRVTGTGLSLDYTPINMDEALNYNLKTGLLLYSTCLEGINNAMYNGKASHISIVITREADTVRLMLTDDGQGCEEIVFGRGLDGINSRVESYGGKVLFESVPAEGFSINLELPYVTTNG